MAFVIAIVVGIVVAAPVLALALWLSRERGLDLLAVQLGAIAAVYAGSSLALGAVDLVATEMIAITAFVFAALYGRWNSMPILAAGYFAHGAWDAIHHVGAVATLLPEWYAPFCLGYDGIVGAFIAAGYPRRAA